MSNTQEIQVGGLIQKPKYDNDKIYMEMFVDPSMYPLTLTAKSTNSNATNLFPPFLKVSYSKYQWTDLAIAFGSLALLFMIGMIIFWILYARQKDKRYKY